MTPIDEQSIAVEVPGKSVSHYIYANNVLRYFNQDKCSNVHHNLPQGKYQLLGICSPEGMDFEHPSYNDIDKRIDAVLHFRFLLVSKGLDPYNKTYAILKRL